MSPANCRPIGCDYRPNITSSPDGHRTHKKLLLRSFSKFRSHFRQIRGNCSKLSTFVASFDGYLRRPETLVYRLDWIHRTAYSFGSNNIRLAQTQRLPWMGKLDTQEKLWGGPFPPQVRVRQSITTYCSWATAQSRCHSISAAMHSQCPRCSGSIRRGADRRRRSFAGTRPFRRISGAVARIR